MKCSHCANPGIFRLLQLFAFKNCWVALIVCFGPMSMNLGRHFILWTFQKPSACLALITSQPVGQGHWQHACPCRHWPHQVLWEMSSALAQDLYDASWICLQKQLNCQNFCPCPNISGTKCMCLSRHLCQQIYRCKHTDPLRSSSFSR